MGYIAWIFTMTVFGAILGSQGWQDPETGGLVGLSFAVISTVLFLLSSYADNPVSVAAQGVERLIDDVLD